MTSLRRALKASLSVEKPPSISYGGRGSNSGVAGEDSRQRRHGDEVGGDRHGFGMNSDRNRSGSGSSSRGQAARRARSSGDGGDDDSSSEDEDNKSDDSDEESDSDDAAPLTSSRGRATVPERRQGSGGAAKPKQKEAEPVSPPRQSVIAAAHNAEIGSQIKVKFDTGHWYSGTILKVDLQRGMIRIDYDDGTQEVSEIPDSDIVIYPWRPAEQRVRPRSLSQMRAEEEKAAACKSGTEAENCNVTTTTGNSRKVAVKTETRLPWTAPTRGKPVQGRQRKGSHNSGKQEQPRAPPPPQPPPAPRAALAGSNGRGAPKAAAAPPSSSSSSDESEEEEDEDQDGDESDEDAEKGSREARKNGRVQQKNGKVGVAAAAARGRQRPSLSASSSSKPGPRKRPAGGRHHGRGGSAPKRRRGSRDGTTTPGGNTSGSGSAASSSEEELDDMSLGIKAKARSPRASPRRKSAAPKTKGSKERRRPRAAGGAAGAAPARPGAGKGRRAGGSSAPSSSSSDSSGSESSSSSAASSSSSSSGSSSSGSEDVRPVAPGRGSSGGSGSGGGGGRSKSAGVSGPSGSKVGVTAKAAVPKGDAGGRGKQHEKDDGRETAGAAAAPNEKEGRSVKKVKEAESESAEQDGGVPGGEARQTHKDNAQEGANVKETKQQNVSTAESSGRANTTTTTTNAAVKAEAHRAETSSKTPSGWQEGAKARERQDSNTTAAAAADVRAAAPSVKASNGTDAGSKGRGRGGRGLSRGGGRAKQAKPARAATEAAASSAEVRSPEGDRRRSEKAVEATTPAPQEAAERKEGHSQDLPSSMRKSPRSKETPSSPRISKENMENIAAGAPEVAEAKGAQAGAAPPRSASPASVASSGAAFGWEAPSKASAAVAVNAGKATKRSVAAAAAAAAADDAVVSTDHVVLVSGKFTSPEGTDEVARKPDGGGKKEAVVEARQERAPGDEGGSPATAKGEPPPPPRPAAAASKPKESDRRREKNASQGKAERKPPAGSSNSGASTAVAVAVVAPPPAAAKAADRSASERKPKQKLKLAKTKVEASDKPATEPKVVSSKDKGKDKDSLLASAADSVDAAPACRPSPASAPNGEVSAGLVANGIRDVASGAMQVDSVDDATTAPEGPEDKSRAPVAEPQMPSAVPPAASHSQTSGRSDMDVDSVDSKREAVSKPREPAIKRRLYSSDGDSSQGSKATIAPGPASPAKGDRKGPATSKAAGETAVAGNAADKSARVGGGSPVRKRPRSGEKQGLGAKCDWPPPVPSRSARLDRESMDVDEGGVDPRAGTAAPRGSPSPSPSSRKKAATAATATVLLGLATSRSTSATRGDERLPSSEADDRASTPSEEQQTTDEGVDSPEPPATEVPSAADDGTRVEADGGHQGQDPGSGTDRRDGGGKTDGGDGKRPVSVTSTIGSAAARRSPKKSGAGEEEVGVGDGDGDGQDKIGGGERQRSTSGQSGPACETAASVSAADANADADAKPPGSPPPPVTATPAVPSARDADSASGPPTKEAEQDRVPGHREAKRIAKTEKEEKKKEEEGEEGEKAKDQEADSKASKPSEESSQSGDKGKASPSSSAAKKSEAAEGSKDGSEGGNGDVNDHDHDDDGDDDDPDTTRPPASKSARSGSADGSDGTGEEHRHVGRKRSGVTRFEPSMDPDRNRLGQRPERHERQAAVLAIKRLAASAPIRRASRGRGHDSGARGRGGRRGRGGGRGSASVVKEQEVDSEEEEEDDDDDGDEVEWVQCDNCEQWWTLPSTLSASGLPDVWHCRMQNWGKPVLDCFLAKEPPQAVAKTGEDGGQRGGGGCEGPGAEQGPTAVSKAAEVAADAAATKAVAVVAAPPAAPAPSAIASAAIEATAAAKADAGLAMVAAVATTAAAMDVTNVSAPLRLPSFGAAAAGQMREISPATPVDPSPRFLHPPASMPAQHRPLPLPPPPPPPPPHAPTMRPPPVHAPAPPQQQVRPVLQFPAALTAENQRAAAAGMTIDDRPVRRKRRREGAVNGSSSDEDASLAAAAAAGRGAVAGGLRHEEFRGRPNGGAAAAAGVSCRGRGRKNSSGSMGRDAVASLLWAAESSRDSGPAAAGAAPEAKDGRAGDGRESGGGLLGRARSDGAMAVVDVDVPPKADEWVMCDHPNCGKWRRVPPGFSVQDVDKWYCQMATWNATPSCEQPEDSTSLAPTASSPSGRPFVGIVRAASASGSGRGGAGAGARGGRRIGSRGRGTSEPTDAAGAGGEGGSWSRIGLERRESDTGARGGAASARGRGRSKKEDVMWVQCDKCLRWRKLALGMRLEDLPDKWYCTMNSWSAANHCSYPDEYDAETKLAKGERDQAAAVGGGGGRSGGGATGGGLLARGSGGGLQKANGRLSYREILFNNDGKLRPPYSAGPCASASAGYLFPKPDVAVPRAAESRTEEGPAPSRTGFYFSEKYCPATSTGPARPPPPQGLLTASLKITGQLKPGAGKVGGGHADRRSTSTSPDRDGAESNKAGGANEAVGGGSRHGGGGGGATGGAGAGAERWAKSNGKGTDAIALTATESTGTVAAATAAATVAPTGSDKQPRASLRRVGTYERERQQRYSVLHYLMLATTPQVPSVAASSSDDADAGTAAAAATPNDAATGAASPPPTSGTAHPDGATATALLATMRERPWEGLPSAGTAHDWAELLEHLDPTVERHLRWLVVDGLAVQSNRDGGKEARFVAVQPTSMPPAPLPPAEKKGREEEETVEPGGRASAGRDAAPAAVTGGKAAAAGGAAGPGADTLAARPSMLSGGVRIMKSRPIKMVKPWR